MSAASCSAAAPRVAALRPAHLGRAADIHLDSFGEEAWASGVLKEVLEMSGAFGRAALIEDDAVERLAGFTLIRVAADEAELLTLCTALGWRRAGIGQALLADFLMEAAGRGAATAYLEVAEDNDAAYALYLRTGFQVVGYRPDYYRRGPNRRIGARLLRRAVDGGVAK